MYDRGRLRGSEVGRRLLGAGPGEEERDVEELLAFAAECWPPVTRLRLYRTLGARRRLGPAERAVPAGAEGAVVVPPPLLGVPGRLIPALPVPRTGRSGGG